MSDVIISLQDAVAATDDLLRRLDARRRQLDDPDKLAIRSVFRALDQTKLHIGAIRRGEAARGQPRAELAELWSDASVAIMHVDADLARRLRRKAEYWSDPGSWRDDPDWDVSIGKVTELARDLLPSATTDRPVVPGNDSHDWDVFISHASEDKEAVARPLSRLLKARGARVWLDGFALRLGDSLRGSIDAGLGGSRFGVVVLSHRFFAKDWPRRELDGLVALEDADRRKRILPVRHGISQEQLVRYSPTLAGRVSVSTDEGLSVVVDQIVDALA